MPHQEHRVRDLAYRLWEEAGRPEGRSDEFWHIAVMRLNGEPGLAEPARPASGPVSSPARPAPATAKPAPATAKPVAPVPAPAPPTKAGGATKASTEAKSRKPAATKGPHGKGHQPSPKA
jgi:hypothetical protein